jgi:hypothetical protein
MSNGISNRLNSCVGCLNCFSVKQPAHHICTFRRSGFSLDQKQFHPCGVAYHRHCIQVGEPFKTRLPKDKGLQMPTMVVEPTFICELCQVRALVGRELHRALPDLQLLCFERMRVIDCRSSWQTGTLAKYGGRLRYLQAFEQRFHCAILQPTKLLAPPVTPSIPLQWAQLGFSLRANRTGEPVKFGTIRQLRSAANMYYMVDCQLAFPHQAMKTKSRISIHSHVTPPDSAMLTFASKGMERRLGSHSKPSWALSHIHIAWIDDCLDTAWKTAPTAAARHNLSIAGFANLMFYLGWLRGGELFEASTEDLLVTPPEEAATRSLPPGVGTVELSLLPETKSDPSKTADIVVAFTTLSGLNIGKWARRLQEHASFIPGRLFSSPDYPRWTSRIFREKYAWPLLEAMKAQGEPSLKLFSDTPDRSIRKLIYSIHSWRRSGRSRVSRGARHNEPSPFGTRQATPYEIYEHGRWEATRDNSPENMPARYNQWELVDRVAITLCCM